MKKFFLLVLVFVCAGAVFAQNEIEMSSSIDAQISTLPEIKFGFTEQFIFPFLQGDSPLTSGNNISLALTAQLSPISLNFITEAIWTPIAFFQFAAGARMGTGWNIELFGSDVYGIGINREITGGKGDIDGNPFDGLLWKMYSGAVLQADLAAFVPGDWNHVVFRTYHEFNYKGYSRANAYDSWIYENDSGENINGFNYYGNFLLGYQMPLFFNMIALLAEVDVYLYDTPNRTGWGDELGRWTFSNVLSFSITENFGVSLVTQLRTQRNFTQSNWKDLYYRNRTIDSSNPLMLEFYRVAAMLNYTF